MVRRILMLFCLPGVALAADLGTWGELWPVAEPDLLTTIDSRLRDMEASGELAQAQEAFKQRVINNSLRPAPVEGLAVATEARRHYIDPSFVVSEDIADPQGRVFARKGERHNPLSLLPFSQTLYFIDADDARQVQWMQQQQPATSQYKIILVRGDIRDSSRRLATRLYFDQQGVMSRKFQLTHIPARVTAAADGQHLQVDTFAMGEAP